MYGGTTDVEGLRWEPRKAELSGGLRRTDMEGLLEFLASESQIVGLIVWTCLGLLVVIIVAGLVQGREMSFWPPRLGANPGLDYPARRGLESVASRPFWVENSRTVDERTHWLESGVLVVGVQYSPKFFKDFFDVIRSRSEEGKPTLALVIRPEGPAARYLSESTVGSPNVGECVHEIERLLKEADEGRGYVKVKMHDRVMRYSFIRTEQRIWIKFFTNASYRTMVPAVRLDSGVELFGFFETDIRKLEEISHG